jgi:hypothetical protein
MRGVREARRRMLSAFGTIEVGATRSPEQGPQRCHAHHTTHGQRFIVAIRRSHPLC